MIVADTSAILAIMFAEPERERFLQTIQAVKCSGKAVAIPFS